MGPNTEDNIYIENSDDSDRGSVPDPEIEPSIQGAGEDALLTQPARDPKELIFTALEIVVIVVWGIFVGREYLNLNPNLWPNGREFGMAVQTHAIWNQLFACGGCMLWNGAINGGAPAFAELHGAVLHPLVIIPTLIWGTINGAKIGLIGVLIMAGLAQWWLAKVLNLGAVARVWAAMMVIVGGHLAGRMDMGVFAILLSTAAAGLVIAAGVNLALKGGRRAAVLLGITLALAIVAGQGYVQIGLLLGIIPAFIILLLDDDYHLKKVWRDFLLAGGLGLLLAAVFLVPLLHFWPNFGKDLDATFGGAQTIGNTLLNLVISDLSFYYQGALGTNPFPYQYVIFVGWIPVLLAILTLRLVPKQQTRLLTFFFVAIILVLLTASGLSLGWLAKINEELVSFVRIPSLIAGLTVPLVLALAAWSGNILLDKRWPLTISGPSGDESSSRPGLTISLSWVVVGILFLSSLISAYTFSSGWLVLNEVDPVTLEVVEEAAALTNGQAQWVQFPFGEHFWAPLALEEGLKVTRLVRPWHWKDRESPAPSLFISTEAAGGEGPGYKGSIGGLGFEVDMDQPYAFVYTEDAVVPCSAQAQGGHIQVRCSSEEPGTLVVQENQLSGWSVRRDGRQVDLEPNSWLSSAAPAGDHEFLFRYQPWDVPLGVVLTLVGVAICLWLWFSRPKERA